MKKYCILLMIMSSLSMVNIYAVNSKMTVTNRSNFRILVVPIPQNTSPYVLFSVPTSKNQPEGFTGTYVATSGAVSIPDKVSSIFFIAESLFSDFDRFITTKKAEYDKIRTQMGSTWRPNWEYALDNEFFKDKQTKEEKYSKEYWAKFNWGKVISQYMSYKTVDVPINVDSATWINATQPPLKVMSGTIKYYM